MARQRPIPSRPKYDPHLDLIEVGRRVLWRFQSLPRDMRWWRGVWEEARHGRRP